MARRPTTEDPRSQEPEAPRLSLGCVGSPENGFADAGRLWSLESRTRVEFKRREEDGQLVVIPDGETLNVDIPLAWVSSRHAELMVGDDGRIELRDCDSRNGTHLRGQRVRGTTEVQLGDIFEVGRSFWTILELPPGDDDAAIRKVEADGVLNPQMRQTLASLSRLAEVSLPLLLTGETGVGKDRLASALHRLSGAQGELVCANVMTAPMERLLFGAPDDSGLLARARGGTLYLDDVGELDATAQTKLLSALMSHAPAKWTERVGNEARIIAASTRDLTAMVHTELFRPDLMARLAGFEARLLPLRERRQDLGLLVRSMTRRPDGSRVKVASAVFRSMLAHPWPFNVRELEHALVAAMAMAKEPDGISMTVWRSVVRRSIGEERDPARIQAVREALVQHLVAHQGDTSAVAKSMHCERDDVERWLEQLSLRPEEYNRAG